MSRGPALPTRTTAVRPAPDDLRHALTVAAKEAVWYATARHRQGPRRNICLFSSRRGGSTWLMQMLEGQQGLRSLNEPLGPWFGQSHQVRRLPKYEAGHPVHFATPDEEAAFRRYVDDLLSGRAPVNAPWWFWRRGYPWISDRLLLKILEAKALMEWFDDNYDVDIVLLVRHPVPQALSCLRNGWVPATRAYLQNPWFRDLLSQDQLTFAERLWRHGEPLEQLVLNWSLENLVPLRALPTRPAWTFVSYEDFVLEPSTAVERLADRLQLTVDGRLLRSVRSPSRSSAFSQAGTRQAIVAGRAADLLGRWRNEVPAEQERRLLDIPARFDIPLYQAGQDRPQQWWTDGGSDLDAEERALP